MTSSQTTPEQAEGVEEFEHTLPGTDRVIVLKKPSEEQMAVLLRLESMLEDTPISGVQLYMDALGALMRDEDEQWCLRALLRGRIDLVAFTDVAQATLFHFYPELAKQAAEREKTSKQHGPTATRRPRRR